MAVLSALNPTWLDFVNLMDPQGTIMPVAEVLTETNEIMADFSVMEGNLPTGHQLAVRTGLPTPTWRAFYQTVQDTKSRTQKITETCGMLEAYSTVDKAMADLNANANAYRAQDAYAHIEAMSQTMASAIFYGNVGATPEKFHGLAPRYNDFSAEVADNMVDAGGTGSDNASIWLICWGPTTCHGIIPKNSKAGLQKEDKGHVTLQNYQGQTGYMEAYQMHFRWDIGLAVPDWRFVGRICNIDRSLLTPDASTGANLPELMFELSERMPDTYRGRCAFYMDRTIRTAYRKQLAHATKQSTLSYKEVGGIKSPMFQDEIPIRRCDALKVNEARVV